MAGLQEVFLEPTNTHLSTYQRVPGNCTGDSLILPFDRRGRYMSEEAVRGTLLDIFGTTDIAVEDIGRSYNTVEEFARAHRGGLPPRDVWVGNPFKDKIKPPKNERGLIDVPAFFEQVLATVEPDYPWFGRHDRHHWWWPACDYKESEVPLRSFRNHSSNVIRLPRVMHNWIHKITLMPDLPDEKVVQEALDALMAAGDFARAAKLLVNDTAMYKREEVRRKGYLAKQERDIVIPILAREVCCAVIKLDALKEHDSSFWPFDADARLQLEPGRVKDILEAANIDI